MFPFPLGSSRVNKEIEGKIEVEELVVWKRCFKTPGGIVHHQQPAAGPLFFFC